MKQVRNIFGSTKTSKAYVSEISPSRKEIRILPVSEKDEQQNKIKLAGGEKAIEKQHKKGRMIARERIDYLIDNNSK